MTFKDFKDKHGEDKIKKLEYKDLFDFSRSDFSRTLKDKSVKDFVATVQAKLNELSGESTER